MITCDKCQADLGGGWPHDVKCERNPNKIKDTIHLNYIGLVDHNDWGKEVFKLTDLFTRDELAAVAASATEDFELELTASLGTENTNGALCTRVRLVRVKREPIVNPKPGGPYR